ncbi:MAG: imelysin family protein [Verrucomicrobiota bacterium]
MDRPLRFGDTMKRILRFLVLASVAALFTAGCRSGDTESPVTDLNPVSREAVVEHYADLAYLKYQDALTAAELLQSAIHAFLIRPTHDSLKHAKIAWQDARIPYAQTEVFRFYGGPIDDHESLIMGWPVDTDYIDSKPDATQSGILQEVEKYPEISKSMLLSLHLQREPEQMIIGYHVIEFLLWGEDTSVESPGQRPYTDYTTEIYADRRGLYLQAAADVLVDELVKLVEAWSPGQPENYRAQFLSQSSEESLAAIFTGLIEFSGRELAVDHMTRAYETQNQKYEESRFSDHTDIDIIENIRGVQNIFLGRYKRFERGEVAGASIASLIAGIDPELAQVITKQLEQTITTVKLIPPPFDHTIIGSDSFEGRKQILSAIELLEFQAETLTEAATALGLDISSP